ncbi:MAG: hypothetical protein ACLP5O_18460 [Acidimicrobiales bacterium]
MTRDFIKAVPQPNGKTIAQMTREEVRQYASDLVDGGIFKNVPGLSSEAGATPNREEEERP